MIQALFIINRNGGLVYHGHYASSSGRMSANDALVFAGTLHGLHAISSSISPSAVSGGLEAVACGAFTLHIYQTLTGVKFVALTDPQHREPSTLLQKAYTLYGDYVMKNPFYQTDMPIRCHLFDKHLDAYCAKA